MAISKALVLTKRLIEIARTDAMAAGAELWRWDSKVRGLGVRVKPNGRASYLLSYRNTEGRKKKFTIGAANVFSIDQARVEALQHLADIKGVKKADPAANRRVSRAGMTVSELCDVYLTASKNSIRQSTLDGDKSRIEIHVKPLLGMRKVSGIAPSDIEALIEAIMCGKTAAKAKKKGRGGRARGGKSVAARTARMLACPASGPVLRI